MEADQHTCIRNDKEGVSIRYILCSCFRVITSGLSRVALPAGNAIDGCFDNDQQTILAAPLYFATSAEPVTRRTLAFTMPTHPPQASVAFTMPTHPPQASVAFTMPAHPPQASVAFTMPAHPPQASVAFTMPAHPPQASVAFTMPTHPPQASVAFTM